MRLNLLKSKLLSLKGSQVIHFGIYSFELTDKLHDLALSVPDLSLTKH